MAEYIDREVCLSILRAKANMAVLMDAAPYFEKAAQMLEKLPAADVAPVVRCKDCKSCRKLNRKDRIEEAYADGVLWCTNQSDGVWPDDFCSYGERKGGETDGS